MDGGATGDAADGTDAAASDGRDGGPDRRTTALGFLVALGALGALVALVGVGDVAAALRTASTRGLVGVVAAAAVWLVSWGLGLWTVLDGLGARIRPWTGVALYAAAAFANNVTPFGQAGGEPVSALLISRTADTEYETGLAAIASVDALNVVPAVAMALTGIGYYATQFTLDRRLRIATGAVVAVGLGLILLATVGWRYRRPLARLATRTVTPVIRAVFRIVPNRTPPARATVRSRIDGFLRAVGQVRGDRRRLIVALGFATVGWLAQMAALWFALSAVGTTVTAAAVLVAVPVGALASAAPVPGGLAGIEATIVAVLVSTAGVAPATATAAVLVHRGAIYWAPTGSGAVAAAVLRRR
jgi:uncharacterized protein (TIRG00374 family)